MAPEKTVDVLKGELLDSDSWGGASKLPSASGTWMNSGSGMYSGTGRPIDSSNTSLEMESSFLSRTGREPTNDEVMEYLEKHKLQVFMTDAIMHVAKHFPPDPFDFLLDHIEAMVLKFRASGKYEQTAQSCTASLAEPAPPPDVTPAQRDQVVRHIASALGHSGIQEASAEKLHAQFASSGDRMTEQDFGKLAEFLKGKWGLQAEDTQLMGDALKRWRFRANATNGTRGLPLWPLTKVDFQSAYPGMLRQVRDRYVPIGSRINQSLFIRQAGGKIEDTYTIGPKLGAGAYGEVRLVTSKTTNAKRVCKQVGKKQSKVSTDELVHEVDLMRGLDHPHIIKLFEYFETADCLEMIMEPVFGGTLTHLVNGVFYTDSGDVVSTRHEALTEMWLARCFAQLLGALSYAHNVAGVVHKDLKLDNVLIVARPKLTAEQVLKEPVHVMLADFGIAEAFAAVPTQMGADTLKSGTQSSMGSALAGGFGKRSTKVGGTPSYMSPEMFKGSFTEKSDIWSLGVMMFIMMTGTMPYKCDNLLMQAQAVCNPRRHPQWDLLARFKWGLGARWFCQQLLAKDEGMRPSAEEASRDTWVTKMSAAYTEVPPNDSERTALKHQLMKSHLMKMSLTCITSQMNLSQLHHLNLRFKRYDQSHDGRLSHAEMRQVLEDVDITDPEDVELIIESMDSDHSGMIDYSEFAAGSLEMGDQGIKDHVRVAFNIFDLNHNDKMELEELRQVLTQGVNVAAVPSRPGEKATAPLGMASAILPDGKTVEEVMKDLDKDKSKVVEYGEFEKYLLDEHKKCGQALCDKKPAKKK